MRIEQRFAGIYLKKAVVGGFGLPGKQKNGEK
jgi:hypothetical protein